MKLRFGCNRSGNMLVKYSIFIDGLKPFKNLILNFAILVKFKFLLASFPAVVGVPKSLHM